MGFFQRLGALFSGKPPLAENRFLPIYVYSHRCREPIAARVDLMNELSVAEESGAAWYARKVIHAAGHARCFDQVEVQIWLDARRAVVRHEVTGGRWLTAEEYAQSVAEQAEREAAAQEAIQADVDPDSKSQ